MTKNSAVEASVEKCPKVISFPAEEISQDGALHEILSGFEGTAAFYSDDSSRQAGHKKGGYIDAAGLCWDAEAQLCVGPRSQSPMHCACHQGYTLCEGESCFFAVLQNIAGSVMTVSRP